MKTVLKWAASVVAFALVDHAVWFLGFFASRSLYVDARYYAVWSQALLDALKNVVSWQTVLWMIVMGLVTGLIYTFVFVMLKEKLSGNMVKKALTFSLITFVTGGVHALLGGVGMLYVPLGVTLAWLATGAVSSVATSFALVAIHRK